MNKVVKTEMGENLPCTANYQITDKNLQFEGYGQSISFEKSDIENIEVTDRMLEIRFPNMGFCGIPLTAFKDRNERQRFIDELNEMDLKK